MPRGFKKDIPETKRLRKEGVYRDKRSFRSVDGHDLLRGDDTSCRRIEIAALKNPEQIPYDEGHWHHVRGPHNNFRRCDCVEGGVFIRPKEHLKEHVQVRWYSRAEKA
jgi:hypothetical protein